MITFLLFYLSKVFRINQTFKYLAFAVITLSFLGCASTSSRKTVPERPAWMDNRPVNSQFFYGIGSALKKGSADRYRNEARENALSEMAGQINSKISSDMVLYKVEDRFGVREMLQNRVRSQSNEFLEGYEFVDAYEDEIRYYTFYRLSKQVFEDNKQKRKKIAADGAWLKYQQAVNHLHAKNYLMAYSFFVQTIEGIKEYLQEGVIIDTPQGYSVDLGNGSLTYLDEIISDLRIKSNISSLTITGEAPDEALIFTVTDKTGDPVPNMPVKFIYSGGYLLTDTGKTDENGTIQCPEFKAPAQSSRETLSAAIDLQALARMATYDIDIRRMLEKWNRPSVKVMIEFVR